MDPDAPTAPGESQAMNEPPATARQASRRIAGVAPALAGVALLLVAGVAGRCSAGAAPWPTSAPSDVGLRPDRLEEYARFVGGRGCVVRHGRLVFSWGDAAKRADVASACKPWFTHFLLLAVAEGRIPSLDEPAHRHEPRLYDWNPELGFKERSITFRHLATQTSCYGLAERPGTAFAYNDWQMALFVDLLFPKVWQQPWASVDDVLLRPRLADPLGCEDAPTFLAMGAGDRAGRLAVSPRDFARFGQLYLQRGRWGDRQLLREDLVALALGSPLPATLPRAGTRAAPMLPGQRTLGSRRVPDNQTEHFGSYSFLWWVNGLEADGHRHWPDAPTNLFAALGHGGIRGLAVLPSLDLVASWNDARTDSPARENEAFRLLAAAAEPRDSTDLRPPAESAAPSEASKETPRLRLIIETDAGGDPDDEQSLVRFLLYANEWDIEGIIANRPVARPGENRNPERTGLGIVRRLIDAYGQCWTNLVRHDPRYPAPDLLRARAVAGYDDTDEAVALLVAAIDRPDPRPVWYSDWGSDRGSATNNLRRALDRVLRERGPSGYAAFKSRLRLASTDAFGPHTSDLAPPFPLWVDTWRPELDRRRWYHRFSALTARAGGFDLVRDCLTGHGPLGALYPTNTSPLQKEGDSLSFLYLVPNGINAPDHPGWGGWGGRLGPRNPTSGLPYFWANQFDGWQGTTNRDNTLLRWAEDLQHDFQARLDACVPPRPTANHPPIARIDGPAELVLAPGQTHVFRAAASRDPDADALSYEWFFYPEAGTWQGPLQGRAEGPVFHFTAPPAKRPETIHLVLRVADSGTPRLARYQRRIVTVDPLARLRPFLSPPAAHAGQLGTFRPVLTFDDGRPVRTPEDWARRRAELRAYWEEVLGPWPPLLAEPKLEILREERREDIRQSRVRLEIAPGRTGEGWLLEPDRPGRRPAVLVVYYEPETSVGLNPKQALRDFGLELTRRGFVTLSIGTPGGNAWKPELGAAQCQPLSFHAYVAANAWQALARRPNVDPDRIGVTGHSYGGKWALFAAALWDRFAAVAVSDPGIVFDESRSNVNYWEPWYLGLDAGATRKPGIPTPGNGRTGAYARLVEAGRDLHEIHALLAPRPFLVSGGAEDPVERWRALNHLVAVHGVLGQSNRVVFTTRPTHDPTPESNGQLYEFFERFLGGEP